MRGFWWCNYPIDFSTTFLLICVSDMDNNEDLNLPEVDKKEKKEINLANLPDLLTVSEVAKLLRVSTLTIKRWGKRGKLPAIRINSRGDRRYKKESVLWMLGINPGTK